MEKKKDTQKKKWTVKEIKLELEKLDLAIKDAEEIKGDIDVRDAMLDKAIFLKDVAKYEEDAEKMFRETYEKSGGASKKMEILFHILQMTIHNIDIPKIKKDIATCKELVDNGADWEKKNKLKVFEGVYCMIIRDFKKAAELFLDSISTFTCSELLDYKDFVFYSVVTALVSQDRATIRENVVHSPDILSVIRDIAHLKKYADSFYKCDYKSFFQAFVEVSERIKTDKFLGDHSAYYTKEMRLVAYRQFLESYKSVTIDNMAESFGVGTAFLDKELSHFISIGKIKCKIDKVAGVIESNKPDKRIELYQQTLKKGDFLLNRVQKLGRALDI
jgi:26S proteasome regulatory subunit N7